MDEFAERIQRLSPEKRELLLEQLRRTGALPRGDAGIPRRADPARAPLSWAQQRLWFLDQLQCERGGYQMVGAIQLEGALNLFALERSLQFLVERHEILRTTFQVSAGEPFEIIAPSAECKLTRVDVRSLPQAEQARAIQEFLDSQQQATFDLTRGPLMRSWLLQTGPQSNVLALAFHHIIIDGWSNDILRRELAECYRAFSADQVPQLPPLPIQYADFAAWQRTPRQAAVLDQQLDYWKTRLSGVTPLRLPTERPRSVPGDARGAAAERWLGAELTTAVRDFSRREGTTLYMTLLACFQTLLRRYCGQTDIAVGTPVANRSRSELEDLIGFFVNTLVMRNDLSGNPTFRELLQRVKATTIDAFAHQELPFDRLVEALHPERTGEQNPLFQVTFALQHAPREKLQLGSLSLSPLEAAVTTTRFNLELHVWEHPQDLRLFATYNCELFEPETVAGLLGHFETLLRGALGNPDQRLADLPLQEAEPARQSLAAWNATRTPFPRDSGLCELFRAQVARTPEAVSLVCGAECWTYRELAAAAQAVSRQLQAHGLRPEEAVAIALEPSLALIAATLGVIEAGGAYVPLDLEAPAVRWQHVLSETGSRIVLTDRANRDRIPTTDSTVLIDVERLLQSHVAGVDELPDCGQGAQRLAYVMYTSGTTGQPKGIAVPQQGVVRLVRNTNYLQIGPPDVVALLSNFAFDGATFEIWGALLNGARLVITPKEVVLSPRDFCRHVEQHGINVAFLTTSLFGHLARQAPGIFSTFRCVLFGGEVADPPLVRGVLTSGKPGRLLHVYGPTECTTFATFAAIESVAVNASSVPIGSPLSNTEAYVLDERLQPVPDGFAGELYLGGPGLARGYVRSPGQTAAKFVPHPFAAEPGERLYATGDFVRLRRDGQLEFLARRDRQIKLRGFRIELGEIETVLRQHGEVEAAVAFVVTGPSFASDATGDRLVACVQTHETVPGTHDRLLQFVRQRLPKYMVPASIDCVSALPLNSHGKIDLAALLDRARHDPLAAANETPTAAAPRTPLEGFVAEIFGELLHLKRVPLHESLFDLGGHSLLATQVVSRLRDVFQVDLPLNTVFREPSVAGLSREIAGRLEGERTAPLPALQPVPRGSRMPASFAQRRLWFLQQMQPESGAWHIPWVVELLGAIDVPALQQSLDRLIQRHESLRTRFQEVDGTPLQIVDAVGRCDLRQVDLRGLPDDAQSEAVRNLASREQREPFQLAAGPLLRGSLLRLDDKRAVLCLTLHHLVADGWSLGILQREFAVCYVAFREGRQPTLPDLPVQYADYSAWQQQCLQSGAWAEQLAYWRNRLADLPSLRLSTDHPRGATTDAAGSVVTRWIDQDLTRALRELNRRTGVTCYMSLLAVFQLLLSRYAGQTDIVVGTPSANRNRSEIEGLIGLFVNSLVMRSDLSGDPTFEELLRRVRNHTLSAFANQDLPFERLVEELNPERLLNRHPLFDVVFAAQNAADEPLPLRGLELRPLGFDVLTTRYDLQLDVWERGDVLQINAFYRCELFERATIERLLDHFDVLLRNVVASPARRLSEFGWMTSAELRQLSAWNASAPMQEAALTLHGWFETQAERTPERIAVTARERQLSYRELDARANRVANGLRRRGVGVETPVGLCLERSADWIVAMLGVLKAGGAYVPLEPAWPDERLALILAETRAAVVISEGPTADRLRSALPELASRVLRFDSDELSAAGEASPAVNVAPENLAYILYTSGSAGRPKGVLVTHANVVRLFLSTAPLFRFSDQDVWTLFHSPAFDFSVWEIWGALLYGGRLVIVPYLVSRSPLEFRSLLIDQRVTILNQTPTAFGQLAAVCRPDDLPALRQIIFGGELLDQKIVEPWQNAAPPSLQMINMYGITETTVHVTAGRLGSETRLPSGRSWIGVRLADLRVYLLDDSGQPVPVGVPGEICVGGAGLARGYLRNPALTAECFIPDAFGGVPGQRLYRSGDLGCFRPDGTLEYVGRRDAQVKVRGFRIELGEIETALRELPGVQEAVVISRQEAVDDQRLVAYVVANGALEQVRQQISGEQLRLIAHWRQVYDDLYRRDNPHRDPFFDIVGWQSSYTGAPIPPAAMREQVDQTVARIRALQPRRLLEIGCGTGLLLFRLAPHCETYLATDVSEAALAGLRPHVSGNVQLLQREAIDFAGIAAHSLDAVVLNSVVQYFPDVDYLGQVLQGACRVLRPGGAMFVGDVRDFRLWPAFQSAVEVAQAAGSDTLADLQGRIEQRMQQETELLLDPAFFTALGERIPEIASAYAEPKRGRDRNELTQFRYDVTLRTGNSPSSPEIVAWQDWDIGPWSVPDIELHLRSAPVTFALRNVCNARLQTALRMVELLQELPGDARTDELRHRLEGPAPAALDPEDLWAIGDRLPYDVHLQCGGGDRWDRFDVTFVSRDATLKSDPTCVRSHALPQGTRPVANVPWLPSFAEQFGQMLHAELKRRLPDYMLPAKMLVLERMPLTAQGKIDRRALPAPDQSRPGLETHFAAPRSPLETALVRIWSEVLHVRQIGIHDNFFSLGGHSLLATQVIARVRDACGVELPLRTLFESPTVAELAVAAALAKAQQADPRVLEQLLSRMRATPQPSAARFEHTSSAKEFAVGAPGSQGERAPPELRKNVDAATISEIPPWDSATPAPLSFAQQRIWFLEQLGDLQGAYHIPLIVQFDGPLDVSVLERSLQAVVSRHEILRTTFALQDGEPVQIVAPAGTLELPVEDLRALPADQQRLLIQTRLHELLEQRFALDIGPLWRARLVRLNDHSVQLVFVVHHILADGWSLGILVRDLAAYYTAFRLGVAPEVHPLPRQYAAYSAWQQAEWNQGLWLPQFDYWCGKLAALSTSPWPTDRPRPALQTVRGGTETLQLPDALCRELQALRQAEQATLFNLLLAAFQVVLSGSSGRTDIALGTPVSGRNRRELEDVIGCFVNTVIFRGDLSGDPTFQELLRQTRDTAWEALAHQDLPFEKLVTRLSPRRDPSFLPLVQILFAVQNIPLAQPEMAQLKISFPEIHSPTARFDLELNVFEMQSGVRLIATYNSNLFQAGTIAGLLKELQFVLERIVADPGRRLSTLLAAQPIDPQSGRRTWRWDTGPGSAPAPEPEGAPREDYEF